jgi:hypothetical protein
MAEALVHLMQDLERHRQRTARLLDQLAAVDGLVQAPVADLTERLRAGDRRLGQLVAELTDAAARTAAPRSATASPREPPMNQEDRHAHALRPVP